ncbi:MAG: BA14K family protein [Brevundimonas sp.]|uniref:BA14K family protein n=1 Tax=Brevundimonas sp. TaxID=1871086 RepID=UPI0027170174|nr:BA14K family protein [Brevundimonas sp.]MDO9609005.1 BA14K family protein [Brevundimonas sp.]
MRKSIIAIAAGLMALSTVSAQAAALDQNRPGPDRQEQTRDQRQDGRPEGRQDDRQNARPNSPNNSQNNRPNANRGEHRDSYGSWQSSWGSRPPAPPAHFSRRGNWYAHVRACQQRYRSYNPRTDRYVPRIGQTAICRL